MKYRSKIYKLLIIVVVFAFSSCQEEITEVNLKGIWKVTDFKADMKGLNPMIIEEGKKLALSSTYILGKNEKFTLKSSDEKAKGSWTYNTESNEIILKYSSSFNDDAQEKYTISEFNGNEMIWRLDYKELGTTEMYLTKQ